MAQSHFTNSYIYSTLRESTSERVRGRDNHTKSQQPRQTGEEQTIKSAFWRGRGRQDGVE